MYTYTNTAGTLITGIPADFSLIDTAKAKILYYLADVVNTNQYDSTYIDFYTPTAAEYDTVNLQMGALSGNAIKARNPSVKMELRFYIPTTNYKNIVIKYGTEASSRTSGQLLQNFDYSIDSGASWITTGLSMTSDSANLTYNLIGLNLASDHSVDNNNKLVFRIKFSGNTMLYAGNNRFDNVTIEGDSINAPYAIVNNLTTPENLYQLYPNPVSNDLAVTSESDGYKTIIIYDITGKSVFAGIAEGRKFQINISDIIAGTYFVAVKDNATGKISKMKFNKI